MELTFLLVMSMLPVERAQLNAAWSLNAAGVYGAKPSCVTSEDGYVCVARLPDGYAVLRCTGDRREECSVRMFRKRDAVR